MTTPNQPPQIPQESPTCPVVVRDYMRATTEGRLSTLPDSQREPILNRGCILEAARQVGVLRDATNTSTEMQRDREGVWASMPSPEVCRELHALQELSGIIGRPICMLELGLRKRGAL